MATPDILQGQNGIILDSARMSMHGLSTPGATFSVPLQENPASQSPNPWVSSDLADREIGFNVGDGSAYYRWGQTISQFGGGTATGPQGPIGSTGPQGIEGPQGVQGSQGSIGPQGVQGIQGFTGPQGSIGIGSTGSTGPQGSGGGSTGPQGPTGSQGFTGPQGEYYPEFPKVFQLEIMYGDK